MIPVSSGQGSAQPGPRKRRTRKPSKNRNPDQAVRLVVRGDGSFVPADLASRRLCKNRGMRTGSEFIAYLYEPRDVKQWRVAHQFGTLLTQNVDDFHGLSSHEALKKIQRDGKIACVDEHFEVDLPNGMGRVTLTRSAPESLAFGFVDESRWTEIYRQMCTYVAGKYFGEIEADAVLEMEKLMLMEQAA